MCWDFSTERDSKFLKFGGRKLGRAYIFTMYFLLQKSLFLNLYLVFKTSVYDDCTSYLIQNLDRDNSVINVALTRLRFLSSTATIPH